MTISTSPLAPSNADLLAFCDAIVKLDAANVLTADMFAPKPTPTIAPAKAAKAPAKVRKSAPTIAPAARKARKEADVKQAANLRETTDGRMMDSTDGSATVNQVKRNTAYAEKHGFIVEDFASFSMADASDWLTDAKSVVAA
jgi:hypothetical protein